MYQSKIDVLKFDATNNFYMLRCKVMDALTTSNLKDSLLFEKKLEKISERLKKDESDDVWRHQIFFNT